MAAPNLPEPQATQAPAQTTPAPQSTWRDALPDELRTHPDITGHQDVASLVKEHVNAQALIGRKGVILPKENDPADQERFWNQLGRPESPDKYDLGEWAPPEGLAWDAEFQKEMLADMHAAGVTNAQAKAIVAKYAERTQARLGQFEQAIGQAQESVKAALKSEWGAATEAKLNLAARFVQAAAGEKAEAVLGLRLADGTVLGDNAEFVRMMAKAAESVGEDTIAADATLRSVAQQTPAMASAEISTLYADKEFMAIYNDKNHPSHEEFHNRMNRLYAIAGSGHGQ